MSVLSIRTRLFYRLTLGIFLGTTMSLAAGGAPARGEDIEENDPLFLPYGFIKAGAITSTRALDSVGNTNMSLPTNVHPDTGPNDASMRSSFQVAQSRLGVWMQKKGSPFKGQFELDFTNFQKASPVFDASPRLRIIKVDYLLSPTQKITVGQDWDPFSPFRPFSNGLIGIMFFAGNVGFMRHQAKWEMTSGLYTLSVAAFLPGRNETPMDSPLEIGLMPALNQQSSFQLSPRVKVGFSNMFTLPKLNDVNVGHLWASNVFMSWKFAGFTEIRSSVYYGQNLGATGALGITTNGNHEAGGYVSTIGSLSPVWMYSGGFGIAHTIEDMGNLWPYLKGFQLKDNMKIDLSLAYRVTPQFKLFSEYVYMFSNYSLSGSQGTTVQVASHVMDLGGRYDF